jgi:spore maturation protein SpmB
VLYNLWLVNYQSLIGRGLIIELTLAWSLTSSVHAAVQAAVRHVIVETTFYMTTVYQSQVEMEQCRLMVNK